MTYLCAFLIECATPPVFMSTACNDLSLDAVKRSRIKGDLFQLRINLMAKINLMDCFSVAYCCVTAHLCFWIFLKMGNQSAQHGCHSENIILKVIQILLCYACYAILCIWTRLKEANCNIQIIHLPLGRLSEGQHMAPSFVTWLYTALNYM